MTDKKRDVFFDGHSTPHTLDGIITAIQYFLDDDPLGTYSLVIGTDSHEKTSDVDGKKYINLVTAIVIHREGFGGRYFWKKQHQKNIYTLRDKIYAETMASLDFAKEFVPLLQSRLHGNSPTYNLEIHVDVGDRGATREMIKEVVGMVTGFGFVARTKPYSYAASYVADKYT